MGKNLKFDCIPDKYKKIIIAFYESYAQTLREHNIPIEDHQKVFDDFICIAKEQSQNPYQFEPYHERIRTPFDYYAFGIDFLKPLVDMEHSSVERLDDLNTIADSLARGDNVVLLANHQTEADPQAISILLEKIHPKIAEEMIFVAGERVTTDPLAIPFSMGRNLLCIYSKKYIDNPPEKKQEKQLHNKKTMQLMSSLLAEGGKCIYVAPSGGRDRRNEQGEIEVAPFDPQSIEMFYLMSKKASHPTHFHPLALLTYDMLPPPETVQIELGEARKTSRGAIHLAFGPCIDMEHFPGSDTKDKHERRKLRAEYICNLVKEDYKKLKGL